MKASDALSDQKCLNHLEREAVARCLQCRRFYCRECISEHEDRSICASCLKKAVQPVEGRRKEYRAFVWSVIGTGVGFLFVWIFFYLIGYALISLPSSFHEGTIWKTESGHETQDE